MLPPFQRERCTYPHGNAAVNNTSTSRQPLCRPSNCCAPCCNRRPLLQLKLSHQSIVRHARRVHRRAASSKQPLCSPGNCCAPLLKLRPDHQPIDGPLCTSNCAIQPIVRTNTPRPQTCHVRRCASNDMQLLRPPGNCHTSTAQTAARPSANRRRPLQLKLSHLAILRTYKPRPPTCCQRQAACTLAWQLLHPHCSNCDPAIEWTANRGDSGSAAPKPTKKTRLEVQACMC